VCRMHGQRVINVQDDRIKLAQIFTHRFGEGRGLGRPRSRGTAPGHPQPRRLGWEVQRRLLAGILNDLMPGVHPVALKDVVDGCTQVGGAIHSFSRWWRERRCR
jgi:hypothetical protein